MHARPLAISTLLVAASLACSDDGAVADVGSSSTPETSGPGDGDGDPGDGDPGDGDPGDGDPGDGDPGDGDPGDGDPGDGDGDPGDGDPGDGDGDPGDGDGDCPDADMDGVCDEDDQCPMADDNLDADMDGVADACDACPLDNPDDADMDGVCESDDLCPMADDNADADLDGICDALDLCPMADDNLDADMDAVPDACDPCPNDVNNLDDDNDLICDDVDICPGGDDNVDANQDGIPDTCALDVLIASGYGTDDLDVFLTGWGFTTTILDGAQLDANFDYGPYDVVAIMFNSALADPNHLEAEVVAGNVGLVLHRSDNFVDDFGFGAAGWYQSETFSIDDNTHFITAPYPVGPMSLDYTYKSRVEIVFDGVTVLGSASLPSLIVHDDYRKVVTPYYGHTSGMPWNDAGAQITWRSYVWAAGVGAQ